MAVGSEVEIFFVEAHELSARHAEDTVPQQFGCAQVCCACGDVALVLDEIATSRDADAVWIFFLGAVVHNDFGVSEFLFVQIRLFDLVMFHDKHGIGAFLASFVISLHHSPKVFSECRLPYFCEIVLVFLM
jgi:hypothetical protein